MSQILIDVLGIVVIGGLVALIYFAMCYPLTLCAGILERKLAGSR